MEVTQTEFQILLKAFNDLVDSMPPSDKIKKELLEISESAKQSLELNYRQINAITERVNNYINKSYGKTKSKENLNYQNQ